MHYLLFLKNMALKWYLSWFLSFLILPSICPLVSTSSNPSKLCSLIGDQSFRVRNKSPTLPLALPNCSLTLLTPSQVTLSVVWLYPSRLYLQTLDPERWSEVRKLLSGWWTKWLWQPMLTYLPQPGWPLSQEFYEWAQPPTASRGVSVLIFHAPCLLTDLANRDEVWVLALRVPRSFWRHCSQKTLLSLLYFLHASIIIWGIIYLLLLTVTSPPHPEQKSMRGGAWFWIYDGIRVPRTVPHISRQLSKLLSDWML